MREDWNESLKAQIRRRRRKKRGHGRNKREDPRVYRIVELTAFLRSPVVLEEGAVSRMNP